MGCLPPLAPLPPGLPPEEYEADLTRIRKGLKATQLRLAFVLIVGVLGAVIFLALALSRGTGQ